MYKYRMTVALGAIIFATSTASAQAVDTPVLQRATVDSAYAAALEVESLAEVIRSGGTPAPYVPDGGLAAAIGELRAASAGRPRPRPELAPSWDFKIEVVSVEPAGPDALVVRGRALLATDASSAGDVVFRLEKDGLRWVMREHDGLVPRLRAITSRLAKRGGR